MSQQLSLALLGGFAAQVDGHPISGFRSQKARALLAYLVMEVGRPHERATLAALFWPELPDALALRNLSQTLVWLRRAISMGNSPFLLLNRRQVQWNKAAAVEVDALRFLALLECQRTPAVAPPDALRQAVALYAGEFLAGFSLAGCQMFDEWLLVQREYLGRLAVDGLSRLTDEALLAGDHAAAVSLARRQLTLDRWREDAIRQLLRALAGSGRRSEALAEYEKARRLLARELGVDPQPETIQLATAIRLGNVATGGSPPVTLPQARKRHAAPVPHNLTFRLTSLLGRENELAALSSWLMEPETRLVTISGIGGVGKTLLALAAASPILPNLQPPGCHPATHNPHLSPTASGLCDWRACPATEAGITCMLTWVNPSWPPWRRR